MAIFFELYALCPRHAHAWYIPNEFTFYDQQSHTNCQNMKVNAAELSCLFPFLERGRFIIAFFATVNLSFMNPITIYEDITFLNYYEAISPHGSWCVASL